jgi:ribosome-associated translation inhibitor RaiA
MRTPIQITYRGLSSSPALEENLNRRAQRLQRLHPSITGCHVTIELPHHHHHRGNHYRVQVELALPGGSIIATRGDTPKQGYEDAHVVIRDAFIAVTRQLTERTERVPHRAPESPPSEQLSRR